jgi:hypothetical protein
VKREKESAGGLEQEAGNNAGVETEAQRYEAGVQALLAMIPRFDV